MMYKSVAGLLAVHNVLGGGDRPAIIVDLTTNFSLTQAQKKSESMNNMCAKNYHRKIQNIFLHCQIIRQSRPAIIVDLTTNFSLPKTQKKKYEPHIFQKNIERCKISSRIIKSQYKGLLKKAW